MLGTIYDINIKSSRKMPSKRFPDSAGIKHKKKVSILVAIDTSGSIDKKELQDFFSEIDYVHKAGARVTLVQCDTCITSISEYDGKIPKICGRGGTSFDPPIEYYVKNKKEYSSLIYFTDGYANTPIKRPNNVIWVVSSSGVTNSLFGKIVQIPKNNGQN
jgi:predicted metal-dependent peptidase